MPDFDFFRNASILCQHINGGGWGEVNDGKNETRERNDTNDRV